MLALSLLLSQSLLVKNSFHLYTHTHAHIQCDIAAWRTIVWDNGEEGEQDETVCHNRGEKKEQGLASLPGYRPWQIVLEHESRVKAWEHMLAW